VAAAAASKARFDGGTAVGVAEADARIARETASRRADELTAILRGEMKNDLTSAQLVSKAGPGCPMISILRRSLQWR